MGPCLGWQALSMMSSASPMATCFQFWLLLWISFFLSCQNQSDPFWSWFKQWGDTSWQPRLRVRNSLLSIPSLSPVPWNQMKFSFAPGVVCGGISLQERWYREGELDWNQYLYAYSVWTTAARRVATHSPWNPLTGGSYEPLRASQRHHSSPDRGESNGAENEQIGRCWIIFTTFGKKDVNL